MDENPNIKLSDTRLVLNIAIVERVLALQQVDERRQGNSRVSAELA